MYFHSRADDGIRLWVSLFHDSLFLSADDADFTDFLFFLICVIGEILRMITPTGSRLVVPHQQLGVFLQHGVRYFLSNFNNGTVLLILPGFLKPARTASSRKT